jgi:starch synthase
LLLARVADWPHLKRAKRGCAVKVLVLYDYPPPPGGLATQGDLLRRGLLELGVDARGAHLESAFEKEWYYRWFQPDVVVGIGYWGMTPHLVLHAQQCGMLPVPWLVANGYILKYREVLSELPLLLVTSNWVKRVYERDGVSGRNIEVLPVGCDTDSFTPLSMQNPYVQAVRDTLRVTPEQQLILTVGGDAASKGGREVMEALAQLGSDVPSWRYVCKVWDQQRTELQNGFDRELARSLGIADRVVFESGRVSRTFMPYVLSACDVYAAPSRIEGFGMGQVEAGACGKPVIGINAMAMTDTLIHGQNALLAGVAQENSTSEVVVGPEHGFPPGHRIQFSSPRIVDYRASVPDIAEHLGALLNDAELRAQHGQAGRQRAVELYDYRVVAGQFITLVQAKLGIG